MKDFRFKILDLRFFILLSILGVFASCDNALEPIEDQALRITLSADTVWLTQNQMEETAVTIKWTSGTNHGTGSAIRYTLFVTVGDTTAAWEQKMNGIRLLSLTHDQLNDSVHKILEGRENLLANEYIDLTLQMQAEVLMTGEIQTSPAVPFVVSAFTKNILYLVGTAAVNGWDKDHPTRVMSDAVDAQIYRWSGTLKKGEFKLLTTTKDWHPCYVRDNNDANKMVLCEHDGDYNDNKWTIKYEGNYSIVCNTRELTIEIKALSPAPDYGPELFIVGSATRYGWDHIRSQKMQTTITETDTIFTWTGELNAGEIKFLTQPDEWLPCYVRDPNDASHILYREGEGPDDPVDYKWNIEQAGTYRITVNITNETISIIQL